MSTENQQKLIYLLCFVVISIAVAGYFIGLQSPMNPALVDRGEAIGESDLLKQPNDVDTSDDRILPATHYAEIGDARRGLEIALPTSLVDLKSNYDLLAEVTVTPELKAFALALRDQNRSFNGAPPTVPHPIEQMSSQACLACHEHGAKTESLRISKMSHQFLANCSQCHVENNPRHMPASLFRESTFVGLPAPTGGPRAFAEAPPQIPHSTWMRVNCMSCHGYAGLQGLRTTHPWRQNCQQCHAPSSKLDQVQLNSQPEFLPPPRIER